jgi:hypothetical protein
MKTKIVCKDVEDALEVQESYGTVKNRLFRGDAFVEITTEKGKLTLSKQFIVRVYPIAHKEKTVVTKGK